MEVKVKDRSISQGSGEVSHELVLRAVSPGFTSDLGPKFSSDILDLLHSVIETGFLWTLHMHPTPPLALSRGTCGGDVIPNATSIWAGILPHSIHPKCNQHRDTQQVRKLDIVLKAPILSIVYD